MRRKLIAVLVLIVLAVVVQTLLPLVSGDLTIASPFLALLTVLSLRQGKLAGVLWGALLGGVSDAYFLPFVGFHGIAFTLAGYLLGWIGNKVVIQGVLPLFFFGWGAYVLDAAVVALLYRMLGLPLPSPFIVLVLAGSVITALLTAGLEAVASRLWPEERT